MARGQGSILRCFVNVNLVAGHRGLAELAKKYEINVSKLEPGQYVVFINSARDRVKVYAAGNVVAYQKLERGQRLDLRTISLIPRVFAAKGGMDYNAALKEAVEIALRTRGRDVGLQVFGS